MPSKKCLELCPNIVECRERLLIGLETPAPARLHEAEAMLNDLVNATARVAISACMGPRVEKRLVEKGGYWQSKKPTSMDVYVCGDDGYSQQAVYYFEKEKMPN